MQKIACVHQGYELYGSDRTFLSCVQFIREKYPAASITVILPKNGLLSEAFQQNGFDVEVRDLWVLRKHYGMAGLLLRGLMLPAYIVSAARVIASHDMTYINTSVIVDFMLAAKLYKHKACIHVHEIPTRMRGFFRGLVKFSGCGVIFNSLATKASFALPASVPQELVYNGVDIAERAAATPHEHFHLLFIGRINDWKGQDLLVEALALLPEAARTNLRVRVVGDVFEGNWFRDDLQRQIESLKLSGMVSLEGFTNDPARHFAWSDAVVVPSRKPEPFGLVAIEAMAHGKPVIAANHGGLAEIVTNETGWFFAPNDARELADAIAKASTNKTLCHTLGMSGQKRYAELFTRERFKESFLRALDVFFD